MQKPNLLSKSVHRSRQVLKYLNAMIAGIDRIKTVIPVHGKTGGETELACGLSRPTEIQEQLSGQVKNLNIVKCRIGYVNMLIGIEGHPPGTGKGSRHIPQPADDSQRLPIGTKQLDPEIHRIQHGDMPLAAHGDGDRSVEPAGIPLATAESSDKNPIRRKNFDQPGQYVCDIEIADRIDRQPSRPQEGLRGLNFSDWPPIGFKNENPLQLGIGEIEPTPGSVKSDPGGRQQKLIPNLSENLGFSRAEIEKVDNPGSGVGHPQPARRIGGHANRVDQGNLRWFFADNEPHDPTAGILLRARIDRAGKSLQILDPRSAGRRGPRRTVNRRGPKGTRVDDTATATEGQQPNTQDKECHIARHRITHIVEYFLLKNPYHHRQIYSTGSRGGNEKRRSLD